MHLFIEVCALLSLFNDLALECFFPLLCTVNGALSLSLSYLCSFWAHRSDVVTVFIFSWRRYVAPIVRLAGAHGHCVFHFVFELLCVVAAIAVVSLGRRGFNLCFSPNKQKSKFAEARSIKELHLPSHSLSYVRTLL